MALQNHKQGKSNELLKGLLPRLKTYLIVTMGADQQDAEDAVHQAFLNAYERIMQDKIEEKKSIYKYLLRACRNEYIRLAQKQMYFLDDTEGSFDMKTTPAEQVENLLDEDRQRVLETCLQKLPEVYRTYITYILKHPDVSTKNLSNRFGISEVNARVRKSRIIDDLSHCVKKELDK